MAKQRSDDEEDRGQERIEGDGTRKFSRGDDIRQKSEGNERDPDDDEDDDSTERMGPRKR